MEDDYQTKEERDSNEDETKIEGAQCEEGGQMAWSIPGRSLLTLWIHSMLYWWWRQLGSLLAD